MANVFFDDASELREAFGLDDIPEYEAYTLLADRKVGFSVQRKYPAEILYIPPQKTGRN